MSKRVMSTTLAAVAILIAGGQVTADSIPISHIGPHIMHLTNYDDGVVYDYNGGFLADGVTPITLGQPYSVSLIATTFNGYALQPGESTWGVFKIDQSLGGVITGPNTITPAGSNITYSDGDAGLELVGIFYGSTDLTVAFAVDPITSSLTQVIRSSGSNFEVFTQPAGTYDDGDAGATARAAANEYPGLGYDGTGTNTLLPGAQLVLTGQTQSGLVTYDAISVFAPSGINTGDGTFAQFISLGTLPNGATGSDNAFWDSNVFPCGGAVADVAGTTADFRLQGTTSPTNKPWLVSSSDPLSGASIPEPATLSLLAIGGAALLRKGNRSADAEGSI